VHHYCFCFINSLYHQIREYGPSLNTSSQSGPRTKLITHPCPEMIKIIGKFFGDPCAPNSMVFKKGNKRLTTAWINTPYARRVIWWNATITALSLSLDSLPHVKCSQKCRELKPGVQLLFWPHTGVDLPLG